MDMGRVSEKGLLPFLSKKIALLFNASLMAKTVFELLNYTIGMFPGSVLGFKCRRTPTTGFVVYALARSKLDWSVGIKRKRLTGGRKRQILRNVRIQSLSFDFWLAQ